MATKSLTVHVFAAPVPLGTSLFMPIEPQTKNIKAFAARLLVRLGS